MIGVLDVLHGEVGCILWCQRSHPFLKSKVWLTPDDQGWHGNFTSDVHWLTECCSVPINRSCYSPWNRTNTNYMNHLTKIPTKWPLRPMKTQISLGIRPDWSESLLCAHWVTKDPSFLHADSEDWSDWVDAQADLSLRCAHVILLVLSWGGSYKYATDS